MDIDELFNCDCSDNNLDCNDDSLVCKVVFEADVTGSTADFDAINEATGCGIRQPTDEMDELHIYPAEVTFNPYSNIRLKVICYNDCIGDKT